MQVLLGVLWSEVPVPNNSGVSEGEGKGGGVRDSKLEADWEAANPRGERPRREREERWYGA